jgi:hypothetical protein
VVFDSVDDAVELVAMKAAGRIGIAGKRNRAGADHEQERAGKRAQLSAAAIAAKPAQEIAGEIACEVAQKDFHF